MDDRKLIFRRQSDKPCFFANPSLRTKTGGEKPGKREMSISLKGGF